MGFKKVKYTPVEAIEKIKWYCAQQERSHRQVREKLRDWGMSSEDAETIICDLISENYMNEERFARAIISGKIRIKGWGRVKIEAWLKGQGVSSYSIERSWDEIAREEYEARCAEVAFRKWESLSKYPPFEREGRLKKHLYQKGFEMELIQRILVQIQNKD